MSKAKTYSELPEHIKVKIEHVQVASKELAQQHLELQQLVQDLQLELKANKIKLID